MKPLLQKNKQNFLIIYSAGVCITLIFVLRLKKVLNLGQPNILLNLSVIEFVNEYFIQS